MTDKLIERIKVDRETGTEGPWCVTFLAPSESMMGVEGEWKISTPSIPDFIGNMSYYPYVSENPVDARRIASVPEMETRILADAKIIRAADELDRIASDVWLTMEQTKLSDDLMAASDTYRAAVSERDT